VSTARKPRRPRAPRAATGRLKQKLRTRRHLVATAAGLMQAGRRPTVAEVADAAEVSRRTAYRYFPTQSKLLIEAALEGLRPPMEQAIAASPLESGEESLERRVDRLVAAMQRMTADHEHLLRSMIHLTVLEPPAGDVPRRGIRRVEWIESAIRPAAYALPRASYEHLVSALTVCTGIEAMVVLRDIRGLSVTQALDISRWMARAVLRQVLADARRSRRRR
jgi:AcrR family transcriptional regulator